MGQETETPYNNNLFSNHFLEERLQNLEEWKQAEIQEEYEKLQNLWEKKKQYLQNNPNEDNTQDEWIDEILKIIGHQQWGNEPTKTIGNGRNLNPDYLFFKDFETKLDSEDSDNQFEEGYLIGEAKKWDRTLDKSMDNHENPSFQIFNYVDRLRTPWGLLTNGKKWRLYSYEDCEADTFYEIDIVETILREKDEEKALQNFKYFYLFFRKESFLPRQNSFVDQVYEGSESYAKDLEDDLEDNIYTALEETARGFFETNDIEKTEENIEEVHRSSLILLYRFLFILNAESRELLPVNNERYYDNFSLQRINEKLIDSQQPFLSKDTMLWETKITNLFEAINNGKEYQNLHITAYNGGLFSEEKHSFLSENKLQGYHVEKILRLLSVSKDEETGDKVLVDYRDLNIRHLGSVYEGLLEHELQQAEEDLVLENGEWESANDSKKDLEELPREKKVREGEVYLTNESGERKATGSYYTPEYIVEYIVENTVGPKVEEKIQESDEEELLDNVLDLNICDPAMGSGHFLTEATSFIARRVIEHGKIQDEEVEGENEFVWVKRQVVSHCIYGVDINPLAVELGKLSLWIETMAEGKPLSFLDHHLKTGNSLVGSNFEEIFSHPTEKQKRIDSDRWQFVGTPEDLKQQFQQDYREIENMDEDTKEKVHEKEQEYKEFKNSTLYKQINQLANLHTRQYFEEEANSTDYEDFIVNIGMENNAMETMEWFKSAQQDAKDRNYFHWEIEFPKVFFGEQEGFDAVVGNPPYARNTNLPDEQKKFYKEYYETSYKQYDIYILFMEKSKGLLANKSDLGFIVSNKFMASSYGRKIRDFMLENFSIEEITDVSTLGVFSDASVYPCIIRYKNSKPQNQKISVSYRVDSIEKFMERKFSKKELKQSDFAENDENRFLINLTSEEMDLVQSLGENSRLGENSEIMRGTPNTELEELDEKINETKEKLDEGEFKYRALESTDIGKFANNYSGNVILHKDKEAGKNRRDVYDEPKILMPRTVLDIKASYDEEGFYIRDRIYIISPNNPSEAKGITGILNSKLNQFVYDAKFESTHVSGGYYDLRGSQLKELPLPEDNVKKLDEKVEEGIDLHSELNKINRNLLSYLGNYDDGKKLGDLYSPVDNLEIKALEQSSKEKDKLQVGNIEVRKGVDSIVLLASARYKPKNENDYETDQHGYTKTETCPIMKFHNLSKKQKVLIEEFVPIAVEKGSGFAEFRGNATTRDSIVDRFKELTLPKVSDIEEDLEKFIEKKERAEELEQKIEDTEEEINQIVYELYDLTEEEIEIVEESVNS